MPHRKTFLVFETTTIVRRIASLILTDFGFEVTEAGNYEKAIEICHQNMPDAILLDGLLSSDGTLKFIQHIRALPDGQHPKIIFTPLEQDAGKLAKILRGGANDYLLRPFVVDHLREKITKVGLLENIHS